MKKIIISLAILGFSFSVNAQSSSDVGKIALSVVMPDNIEGMDVSQISKLQTKITQILTVTGLGASGYNNNFVISSGLKDEEAYLVNIPFNYLNNNYNKSCTKDILIILEASKLIQQKLDTIPMNNSTSLSHKMIENWMIYTNNIIGNIIFNAFTLTAHC